MMPLRINDNSTISKASFKDIPNLTRQIIDKTLAQFEHENVFIFPEILKDAKDLSKDQIVLQSADNNYRSGNVMEYLGCGSERLVIASRFCDTYCGDYFLQYLLCKVLDFPNLVDFKIDNNSERQLFDFLIFVFPY